MVVEMMRWTSGSSGEEAGMEVEYHISIPSVLSSRTQNTSKHAPHTGNKDEYGSASNRQQQR